MEINRADQMIQEPKCDVLCVFGMDSNLYSQLHSWLQKDAKRRLFFVEDRARDLELSHPQVQIFFLETPLQIPFIASQIAKEAVLLQLEIMDLYCARLGFEDLDSARQSQIEASIARSLQEEHHFQIGKGDDEDRFGKVAARPNLQNLTARSIVRSSLFVELKKQLLAQHLLISCLLSDVSDFGVQAARHAKENSERHSLSFVSLKNAFSKIPAIVVGAGPSLEKHRSMLAQMKDKALILAGGTALSKLGFEPHFAAAIDKDPLVLEGSIQSPLCFPPRVHPETLRLAKGALLQVPDSHFAFLNWIMGEETLFESGWTVGTFLVALAQFLGCDPIVSVGMDYCYQNGKKYAFSDSHSSDELVSFEGHTTQTDWVMAISWLKEFQKKHPQNRFFQTEGGFPYFDFINLQDVHWQKQPRFNEKIQEKIQSLPFVEMRWNLWEESLRRVLNQLMTKKEIDEEEVAFRFLLDPLWQLWRSVFERETGDLQIHQKLFFYTVIEQHLSIL